MRLKRIIFLPLIESPDLTLRNNPTPLARAALFVLRGYKLALAPFLLGSCRFVPSCSEFAREAILTHGALRGGWMAFCRVLRCQPLGGAGLDPVPGPERHGSHP